MGILKPRIISPILAMFLISTTSVQALPINAPVTPARSSGKSPITKIGVIAAVKGSVKIGSQGQIGHIAGSGEHVYLGDEISTDEKSSLQILLLDQTTFTIGANSTIVIDKFIYDPTTNDGEVRAKVVKGVFRFVTGKIGQKKPSQMAVDLPVGTIGIRGTIVAGEASGNRSMVALLGPGQNNNTGHNQGSFSLQNNVNGQMKESVVSKTGFGATIDDSGEPSSPFQVPEADLNRLSEALGPSGENSSDNNSQSSSGGSNNSNDSENNGDSENPDTGSTGSPTEQAGQDVEMSGDTAGNFFSLDSLFSNADQNTSEVSQDELEEFLDSLDDYLSRISTYEDLRSVSTGGQYHYSSSGIPLYDTSGTHNGDYAIDFNIDFQSQTVGGGNSKVVISGITGVSSGANGTVNLTATQSFASGSGEAFFEYTNQTITGSSCSALSCKADIYINLLNTDTNHGPTSTIATSMESVVVVQDPNHGSSDDFVGYKSDTPRSSGLTP